MEDLKKKNDEQNKKRRKINLIIIGVAVLFMIIILPIISRMGERSVTDLHNFGVFSLFASDNEKIGESTYRVEYYYLTGEFNLDTFIELSRRKKNIYRNSSTFVAYYLVLFNSRDNVYQSRFPITALYGSEIENLRNILAFYIYTGPRGVSQIRYYEHNAADSMPRTINVE
jgi:hypothetical protein